jgi:ANTAR domain
MDVIRVHAPSDAHARRLLTSLDGNVLASLEGDGDRPVVGLRLDADTATKLVGLFDALGEWLTNGDLASCHIGFGDRAYTLLPAAPGQPNDPTAFLLERTIQLQTALDSRIVIEQAKGILAERLMISPAEAFEGMRRDSRSRRIKLRDLAAGIVATTVPPRQT